MTRVSSWRSVGYLTSLGWMIALPIATGVLLGRFVDERVGSGTFWTLALLGAGIGIGCLSCSWRFRQRSRRVSMTDSAALAVGVLLGLWSTRRLERDVAALVLRRRGSLNLACVFGRWLLRSLPILAAVCVLAQWSSSAPLAAFGGFWLGRTSWLVAAVLKSRRFA